MAAEASRSSPSADSYIGSFISLTSKSEIRYEGILYSINSEESTIGLSNVRSFGTEGRKKDGQQLPAGDKIYEFILFRGSDIKDLQVKASPPALTNPRQHDPAIIQSNYLHPSTASLCLPANLASFGSISVPELSSNTAQLGLQQPIFQGSLPAHQTGGSFGTWSAIPPPQAIPMYWQGYYAHSQGLSHLQQLPLIRPLPALAMPPMQQASQSQGTNALLSSVPSNYPEFLPLFPSVSSSLNSASTSIPSSVSPIPMTSLTSEMSPFSVSNKIPETSLPAPIPSLMLLPLPSIASIVETSASLPQNIPSLVNSISRIGHFSSVGNQTETRSTPPIVGLSGSKQLESSDTLVTLDQLKQLTSSATPSSQSLVKDPIEVEVQPPEDRTKALLSEWPAPKSKAETKLTSVRKEPILPLPSPAYQMSNGALLHATQTSWGYGRGRGRGRGSGYTRPVVKFSEEFDFTAMNEKFNKDKVWGNLGKSRAHSSNSEDDEEADQFDKDNAESLKLNIKPVYVKDEFFDTLSCNANEQTNNGRNKFSEQLKIDTETFGNFQLNNSTYGGGRELQCGGVGGSRGRSSYPGRSYGYSARGRGYNRTVEHHKVPSERVGPLRHLWQRGPGPNKSD